EGFTPPREIIRQVGSIAARVELDVGGIEYLIDPRDGRPYFYDINALSNFVADAPNVIGFDPFAKLVDYLAERVASPVLAGVGCCGTGTGFPCFGGGCGTSAPMGRA